MKDRIQRILDFYQLSASEFAKIIGVNASGISHILSGNRNYLSTDSIIKLSHKFPEIALDWLILGEGEMIPNGSSQVNLFDDPKSTGDGLVTSSESHNISATPENKAFIQSDKSPLQTTQRQVKRIVIFYDDNTFQDMFP